MYFTVKCNSFAPFNQHVQDSALVRRRTSFVFERYRAQLSSHRLPLSDSASCSSSVSSSKCWDITSHYSSIASFPIPYTSLFTSHPNTRSKHTTAASSHITVRATGQSKGCARKPGRLLTDRPTDRRQSQLLTASLNKQTVFIGF